MTTAAGGGIGYFGITCGAKTTSEVVRKTTSGPLHKAVCNRWAEHGELHRMTDVKTFVLLYEWGEDETAAPDLNDQRRKEMALSKAKGEK